MNMGTRRFKMLENYFSVQDMIGIGCVCFLVVKYFQRLEGWGWKNGKR